MSEGIGPVQLPSELIKFYEGLRDIQLQNIQSITKSQVFSAPAGWVWDGASPVITAVKPVVGQAQAGALFRQLLELVAAHKPVWTEDVKKLSGMAEKDLSGLLDMVLQGNGEGTAEIVSRLEVHPEVAEFALLYTVKPFLQVFAENAKPYIESENWLQSYCPVCGSKAKTARIDGAEGRRHLRCTSCDTEWLFKLLCCPFCGNDNHRSLKFLQIEETPGYGLHVCEQCKGYLKVIDEQKGGSPELLSNEAATVFLDLIAQQQGYRSIFFLPASIKNR